MSTAIPHKAAAVTPSDTVNFARAGWVFVGGAGVVAAVPDQQDTAVNFTVPAGATLPVLCKRVNLTNTTATLMVVVYE